MELTTTVKERVYTNQGNDAVLKLIEGTGKRILDVGCGAGDNGHWLKVRGHYVDGITFSEEEWTKCKQILDDVFLYDLEKGLPTQVKGQYDYVICSHVLEHISYPTNLLGDILKILKDNGKLIVALPNIMHYQSRWKLFVGDFPSAESGIWDNTHVRWYTFKSGRQLLEKHNYVVDKKFVTGDIPFLRVFGFIPSSGRKFIYSLLVKISKGFFGGQLIYVAKVNKH